VKTIPVLLLAALALPFAGCGSSSKLPSAFRERIAPTYRTHVVAAAQKPVYEAAKAALHKINYTFTSGGAAQGKLEAMGALQPGDGARSARQLTLSLKLAPAANGGTEVSALFSEIREDEFSRREGMGTSTPMMDTPMYEVFFRYLDEQLAKPAE
jgi:hypothetical protein